MTSAGTFSTGQGFSQCRKQCRRHGALQLIVIPLPTGDFKTRRYSASLSPDERQLTKRAKTGAKHHGEELLDAGELAFRVSSTIPPYQDDLENFVKHHAELTERNALVEALRHLAGECEAWAAKPATDSETTSDRQHGYEAPGHSTDNEMVADPKKDYSPIFLHTLQNWRVGDSANPPATKFLGFSPIVCPRCHRPRRPASHE